MPKSKKSGMSNFVSNNSNKNLNKLTDPLKINPRNQNGSLKSIESCSPKKNARSKLAKTG